MARKQEILTVTLDDKQMRAACVAYAQLRVTADENRHAFTCVGILDDARCSVVVTVKRVRKVKTN